jgi:hypothetical protein
MTLTDGAPTTSSEIVGRAMPGLTVDRVEVIPVVAPLARVFQGSYYKMDSPGSTPRRGSSARPMRATR